jgi:hypothetical protein
MVVVSGLGQPALFIPFIGSFSLIPRDALLHMLSFLPSSDLGALCLTHKNLRVLVNETRWGMAKSACRVFNSLITGVKSPQPKISYVLEAHNKNKKCKIQQSTGKVLVLDLFPELIGIDLLGAFKISETQFVCVVDYMVSNNNPSDVSGHYWAFKFEIGSDLSLARITLRPLSELFQNLTPAISQKERSAYPVGTPEIRIHRIYQIGHLVHIEVSNRWGYPTQNFLLTHEINSGPELTSCCLGKRIYTLTYNTEPNTCSLETESGRQSIEIRKGLDKILRIQDRWLLARYSSKPENKIHYVFYDIKTGREVFCYSLDVVRGDVDPASVPWGQHNGESDCCYVAPPSPPDYGQWYEAEEVFIKGNFCILYHPFDQNKNLAALIWIDKQLSIFLNDETQRLLCSFDRITDLAYDSQPDGSIRVMIEGLRDFDKLRIETIVNIQNPPHKNDPEEKDRNKYPKKSLAPVKNI